jgi:hypothetical protein
MSKVIPFQNGATLTPRDSAGVFHSEAERAGYGADALADARRKELTKWTRDAVVWGRAFTERIDNLERARARADAEKVKPLARQIALADRALELWSAEIALFCETLRGALADELLAEFGDDANDLANLLRANESKRVTYFGI